MPDWLQGPRLADLVLAVLALEVAICTVWALARRDLTLAVRALPALAAGLCLAGALRVALADGPPAAVAALLAAALVAHVTDFRVRLRGRV